MIAATYFDGRSARGQPVQLRLEGGRLHADAGPGVVMIWSLAEVQWPERTRHGQRVIHLRDGGSLMVADAAAFDAWRRRGGLHEPWIVRLQQSWRATLVALVLLAGVGVGGYLWGVPAAAGALLLALPASVDEAVGQSAYEQIASRWLQPSALPAARQQEVREAFAAAVARAYPAPGRPRYELQFHAAGGAIGPNAFALPGGRIVVTDALVTLLQGHDDTLIGVLGHELGHVQRRHGMRALVSFTLVGAATGLVFGDFSSLLAGAPAWVLQMGYARDAEREADAQAVLLLRASGRSPRAMVTLFEKLRAAPWREDRVALPIALASHPMDEERVAFFDAAAAAR